MKLFNFEQGGKEHLGVFKDDKHYLVRSDYSTDQWLLEDMPNLDDTLLKELDEEAITFLPVVLNPEKILCIGFNYMEHISEAQEKSIPKEPIVFSKFNNALAAHRETVILPKTGTQFDYEAELVIVVGKEAYDVSEEDALGVIAGYSCGNDLSIRDLQFKTSQWLIGKSADQFAPTGPYLVVDEILDPQNLLISLFRNGKKCQSSNTKHMIFSCAQIVSYISTLMTLQPGDIIFTGTPEGVVLGKSDADRVWLKSGEVLDVIIEGVGKLQNKIGGMD